MIPFYTSYNNSYLHFSCIHEGRGSWRAREACCKPASSLPVLEELNGKDVRCEKWNEIRWEGLVVKILIECHAAPTPPFDVTSGWKECSEAEEEKFESGFKISTQASTPARQEWKVLSSFVGAGEIQKVDLMQASQAFKSCWWQPKPLNLLQIKNFYHRM